jgi:hypothetical protein
MVRPSTGPWHLSLQPVSKTPNVHQFSPFQS